MPEKFSYSLNLQVASGPKLSEAKVVELEAYDKLTVTIKKAAQNIKIELQPGGAGQVQLLFISADKYGDKLTYKVNASAAAGDDIISLDGPLLLLSKGAVKLLDAAPSSLFFSNGLAEDVTLQILVGRDATP
jgi:hypothetical protein